MELISYIEEHSISKTKTYCTFSKQDTLQELVKCFYR